MDGVSFVTVICRLKGLNLSSTGALLILGGLMLNLVASGMLLRPINVKPPSALPSTSPSIQKSPTASPKSSSEKEHSKSCLNGNGSSHLSNGISKSDLFPSPPHNWDPENPVDQSTQGHSIHPEQTRLVLNGVNGYDPHHDLGAGKPRSSDSSTSTELNGSMNGSAVAGLTSHAITPSEVPGKKVLDFSLLKDPFFCIYTWSLVFSQLAYFIPYFHLSARARTLGINAMDASFIISVAGEVHTIGN